MLHQKISHQILWVLILIFSSTFPIFLFINASIVDPESIDVTYNKEKFVKRLSKFYISSTASIQNNSTKILDHVCQDDFDCFSGVGTNASSIIGNYACVDNKCKYVVAAGEQCNFASDCAASLYYIKENQTVESSLCSSRNCNLNSKCSSAWDPQIFNSPSQNFNGFMCCGGIKENDNCQKVATNVDPCNSDSYCELDIQSSAYPSQYICVSKRHSNVMVGVVICLIGSTVLNVGLNIQKYAYTKHQENFNEQKLEAEGVNEESINKDNKLINQKRDSFTSLGAGGIEYDHEKRTSLVGSIRGSDNIEHSRLYMKLEKFMFWKQIIVSPLWVIGFLIYLSGTMMGFIALQFAPQSLVAPLGSVSLITNLLIAPILHSQRLTLFDIFGVIMIIGGCVVITIFSGVVFQDYKLCVLIALFERPSTIIYLSIISCFIAVLIFFIKLESRNADAPNALSDEPSGTDVNDVGEPEITSAGSINEIDERSDNNLVNLMQDTENNNNSINRSSQIKHSIQKPSEETSTHNEIFHEDENIGNAISHSHNRLMASGKSAEKSEKDINSADRSNNGDGVRNNRNNNSKSVLIRKRGFREKFLLPIAYAVLASSMATLTTLFAKSLINLLTQTFIHHDNQFNNLISWIILMVTLVTAVGQVYWLNIGLKKYDALIQVPIFFCNWSVYDIIGGGIYYDEFKDFTTIKYLAFVLGITMIFFGVVLLSKRLAKLTEEEVELNANQKLIEMEIKEMKRKRIAKNESV